MGSVADMTGLRDQRKPCHFWIDNEVADCYQPILGADAIWVYCRIARYAHGAWIVSPAVRTGDSRVSLREMASWCSKSVDTVWRCLQLLEHVGLVRSVRGVKTKGRYALADVKELVLREGAQYDSSAGCFKLPPERVEELKAEIRVLRAKLARSKAAGDSAPAKAKSVAHSDRLDGSLFSAPAVDCDRSVAHSDKTVAREVQTSTYRKKQDCKTERPPQSPIADATGEDFTEEQRAHLASLDTAEKRAMYEGYYREENQRSVTQKSEDVALRLEFPDTDRTVARVMERCRFVLGSRPHRNGIPRVLGQVVELESREGAETWVIGPRLIAAWEAQDRATGVPKYGPLKFYRDGHWRKYA